MNYDVGMVAEDEARYVLRSGAKLPAGWSTPAREPFTSKKLKKGKTVGFLRLPPLPDGEAEAKGNFLRAVTDLVKKYKPQVDLLVALSSWGMAAERQYGFEGQDEYPHLLLGSGRGPGNRGITLAEGEMFWIRPFDKGKSMAQITFEEWPKKTVQIWQRDVNVKFKLHIMDYKIYDNAKISNLFKGLKIK